MIQTDNNISSTKRIARNSAMLYFRMFILMAVKLYTSRVVLNALGVEDFGIYNVVGGIIVMFAFVNNAMIAATQRFLAFEIGKNNVSGVKMVFNTSLVIHFALALLILVFGETIGLWFLNTQLNIPEARMDAAFWVYQFSVLACIVNIISIPYNALITAYERMSAFAWISLFEAGGQLLSALLLLVIVENKLIWYALFICIVQIIVRILYGLYCRRKFKEIKFTFNWSRKYFKEMFAFSGWNMIGSLSVVFSSQGLNMLLNIFFNPIANAAKGIADQVQGAVNLFYINIQQAINPQIVKSYAAGDMNYMHKLIFTSSRLSFFVVLILALPITFEADYILHLWLKIVPDNTAIFTRLSMVICVVSAIANPLITGNLATGKVKTLLLTVGIINCMVLPLAWIWLRAGGNESTVFLSWIIIVIIAFIVRLIVVQRQLRFSMREYMKECLLPIAIVLFISFIAVCGMRFIMPQTGLLRFLGTTLFSTIVVLASVWLFGITFNERLLVKKFVAKIVQR